MTAPLFAYCGFCYRGDRIRGAVFWTAAQHRQVMLSPLRYRKCPLDIYFTSS